MVEEDYPGANPGSWARHFRLSRGKSRARGAWARGAWARGAWARGAWARIL